MIPLAIDLFAGTPVAAIAFAVKVVGTAGFMVTAFALSLALPQALPLLMLARPLLMLALSLLALAHALTEIVTGSRALLLTGIRC